jgi:hypothetical protein
MWGYQLKQILLESGDHKSNLENVVATSSRVNVLKSVENAQNASVESAQPDYQISASAADRELASSLAGGGCGRVTTMYGDFNKSDWSGGRLDLALLLLVAVPVLMVLFRKKKKYNRRFERFEIASTVRMMVGDQVYEGRVNTISAGGAGLNVPAHLEEGSVLTMSIASPDGKESITVQGQVVWSHENEKYGVSFAQVENGVQQTIRRWTLGLAKSR